MFSMFFNLEEVVLTNIPNKTAAVFLEGVSQRASASTASLRGGCTMASGLTFGESWGWLWWLWHGRIGGRWGASMFLGLVWVWLGVG